MNGNFFRTRREELKKTQRDIALALNMTTSAISAWENGVALPEWKIIDRVAEVYDVSARRLMDEMKAIADERTEAAAK